MQRGHQDHRRRRGRGGSCLKKAICSFALLVCLAPQPAGAGYDVCAPDVVSGAASPRDRWARLSIGGDKARAAPAPAGDERTRHLRLSQANPVPPSLCLGNIPYTMTCNPDRTVTLTMTTQVPAGFPGTVLEATSSVAPAVTIQPSQQTVGTGPTQTIWTLAGPPGQNVALGQGVQLLFNITQPGAGGVPGADLCCFGFIDLHWPCPPQLKPGGCPPGAVSREGKCVPLKCVPPTRLNRDRTACVCPDGMKLEGNRCTRELVCAPPARLNRDRTACVCPDGMKLEGNRCRPAGSRGDPAPGPRGGAPRSSPR
jgi:hypothetical protein